MSQQYNISSTSMTLKDVFDAFDNDFQKTPQKVKRNHQGVNSYTRSDTREQQFQKLLQQGSSSSSSSAAQYYTATTNVNDNRSSPYDIEFDVIGNPLLSEKKQLSSYEICQEIRNTSSCAVFEKRIGFQQSLDRIYFESDSEQQLYEADNGQEDQNGLIEEEEESQSSDKSEDQNQEEYEIGISQNIERFIDPEKENKDPLGGGQSMLLRNHKNINSNGLTPHQSMHTPWKSRTSQDGTASIYQSSATAARNRFNKNQQSTQPFIQTQLFTPESVNYHSSIIQADGTANQIRNSFLQQQQQQTTTTSIYSNQESNSQTNQFQVIEKQSIRQMLPSNPFNYYGQSGSSQSSSAQFSAGNPHHLYRTPLRDITTTSCPSVSRWDLSPYIPTNINSQQNQAGQLQYQQQDSQHTKERQLLSTLNSSNRPAVVPPAILYR